MGAYSRDGRYSRGGRLFNNFTSRVGAYSKHYGINHEMCLLAEAVAPRTGKIIENGLSVFERGEHFLQNGILNFALR